MARPRGGAASAWRQRFRRYSLSGATVAEFCLKEGVSVSSFYAWRRKHSAAASDRGSRGRRSRSAVFQPISLVGTSPVMSARLPNGVQVEVGVSNLELVRVVLRELVCADRAAVRGEPAC